MSATARLDMSLVRELQARVADRLQHWITDQQRDGHEIDIPSRRQVAASFAHHEIEALDQERIRRGIGRIDDSELESIVREVLAGLFGAGGLQALLDRLDVTNIYVKGTQAWVETTNGVKHLAGSIASTEDELIELVRQMAATEGRTAKQFNLTHPMLSMRLPGGQRLSAVLGVSDQLEVAIRRQTIVRATLEQLVELGTLTPLAGSFCRALVLGERNIVVSGGTNSGKTTMVRALCDEIPESERVVTIEDTCELNLRDAQRHPDVVSLESRDANVEGVGGVSLDELARHALRLSPNRVIVGEVRGNEVVAMCSAMTQGNAGSMCSVHAESSEGALKRLRMYLGRALEATSTAVLTDMVAQSVDYVIHMTRRRHDGQRAVSSIREVVGSADDIFSSNEVFTLDEYGELTPTGALSERSRLVLADAGFDVRRIASRADGWT